MEQSLAESIAPRRFSLLLLGTFAFVAACLAVLGVYGVVAHAVAERTHEIGIRLALGAERRRVVGMIVSEGMLSVIAGVAIGTAAAVGATSLIGDLLYGVEARDPVPVPAAAHAQKRPPVTSPLFGSAGCRGVTRGRSRASGVRTVQYTTDEPSSCR